MPYIKKEDRPDLDKEIDNLIHKIRQTDDKGLDGVLNYTISRLISGSMEPQAGWRYHYLARAVAIFECAKLEFCRRIANMYEDKAIAKNGDIPEYMD